MKKKIFFIIFSVFSLFLAILFILSWHLVDESLMVQTEEGQQIYLENVQFGQIILPDHKAIINGTDSKGHSVYNLGTHERVIETQKFHLKKGLAFGVSWKIPEITKKDELVIDVEVLLPHELALPSGKNSQKIEYLWKYSAQDSHQLRWLGWQLMNLDPQGPPLTGPWTLRYRNRGVLIAEKKFNLLK